MSIVLNEETTYKKFCTQRNLTKALNSLVGLIAGIEADGHIDELEQLELANWIQVQSDFWHIQPFNEIIALLQSALSDGVLEFEELNDIKWVCNQYLNEESRYSITTQLLQELHGFLHGISANNNINIVELKSLRKWLNKNKCLVGSYPYDEIHSVVSAVLKDGILSADEELLLRAFFGEFIDTTVSLNISQAELNSIRKKFSIHGVCAMCPNIIIKDHLFCFTGKSSCTTRKGVADAVESKGGLYNDNVLQKTQYLVIGNDNSPCWAYSCFGRKVEKAVEMRKNGSPILIVHENDFWDALQTT